MNLNHTFCLSGRGYLHDLYPLGNRLVAKVKILPTPQAKDEVWLDCIVTDTEQQTHLSRLFKSAHTGAKVLMNFEAEYKVFVYAYSALVPEDPNHMVLLQATLLLLGDCYVNGQLIELKH